MSKRFWRYVFVAFFKAMSAVFFGAALLFVMFFCFPFWKMMFYPLATEILWGVVGVSYLAGLLMMWADAFQARRRSKAVSWSFSSVKKIATSILPGVVVGAVCGRLIFEIMEQMGVGAKMLSDLTGPAISLGLVGAAIWVHIVLLEKFMAGVKKDGSLLWFAIRCGAAAFVFFTGFVLFVIHFSYFMACVALALLFWLVACLYYYAIPPLEFSVSVVVPLYQKENEIERCLSSAEKALKQANVEYEIIVVDDGSSDNSARIVQDWKRKNEERKFKTHLIRQENKGVSVARNIGWRAAAKEWVAFLDADDEWRLDHVIRLKELALDFPDAVLLATAWSEVGTDGRTKSHEFGVGTDKRGVLPCFFKAMATGPMVISSSTACAKKSVLEKTSGFPEGVRLGEDKVAWGRLALLGPVAYDPEIGAIWHKDAQNRSDGPEGPQVSDAFLRLLVEPALEDESTPKQLRPGLEDARLVELARINGVISIYDHDTPEKLRGFVKSL